MLYFQLFLASPDNLSLSLDLKPGISKTNRMFNFTTPQKKHPCRITHTSFARPLSTKLSTAWNNCAVVKSRSRRDAKYLIHRLGANPLGMPTVCSLLYSFHSIRQSQAVNVVNGCHYNTSCQLASIGIYPSRARSRYRYLHASSPKACDCHKHFYTTAGFMDKLLL